MPRAVTFHVLRGTKASMPTLGLGELYLSTDEAQLYVGTNLGNKLVVLDGVNTPPAVFATCKAPMSSPGGPVISKQIVAFTKVILGGTTYWIPMMQ